MSTLPSLEKHDEEKGSTYRKQTAKQVKGKAMKRLLYYVGWFLVIGSIIYLGTSYKIQLQIHASETFNLRPVVLFTSLFPIIIGILLKLPQFITEIRLKKQWTFDWLRFIVVGLPPLCILSLYMNMEYIPETIITFIPQAILFGMDTIQPIAGIVFGYVLLDSFKSLPTR